MTTRSVESERERARHSRIRSAVVASAAARGVTLATVLLAVPLGLGYLGPERYGLWVTITTLALAFTFVDLGLGHSLVTEIAQAVGREDAALVRRYVSSAMFVSALGAAVVSTLFLAAGDYIPWARLYNVSDPVAVVEARPASLVAVTLLLLGVPLGLVQRVQAGHQRGFENGVWQAAGNALGLLGMLLAIRMELGLPWLVAAFSGLPLVAFALQSALVFGRRHPQLCPEWRSVSRSAASTLLRSGLGFFVIQVSGALALSSDNLIAAQILGAASVAEYSVAQRLFNVPALIVTTMLMPLWPAYGEAVARGDHGWVRRAFLVSLVAAGLVAALPASMFVIWGQKLIQLWVGSSIHPSLFLLSGLGVWTSLQALGNAVAVLLNGTGVIRFQVVSAIALAISGVALKCGFGLLWGLGGIAWGGVLAYTICAAVPYSVVVPRLRLWDRSSAVVPDRVRPA